MYGKNIKNEDAWRQEYLPLQRSIQRLLKEKLKWNNGTVVSEELSAAFAKDDDLPRLKQKLFYDRGDYLEWRQDIADLHTLALRLKTAEKDLDPDLVSLFYKSKNPKGRTNYPHLVCTANKIKDYYTNPQLFCFDILVRPPCLEHDPAKPKHNFRLGSNSIALFVQTNLDSEHRPILKNMRYRLVLSPNIHLNGFLNRRITAAYYRTKQSPEGLFLPENYAGFINAFVENFNNVLEESFQQEEQATRLLDSILQGF